jgi:hypothetical protein
MLLPLRFFAISQTALFEFSRVGAARRQTLSDDLTPGGTQVGGVIKEARGWKVDLDNPDLEIHIELLTNERFTSSARSAGLAACPRVRPAALLPDVRRHRFTGGGAPDDEARSARSPSFIFTAIPSSRRHRRTRRVSSCGC